MHICYLSPEYPLWITGGIGTFIQTIGKMLVKNGHYVTIIGHSNVPGGAYLNDEGIEIYRTPAPKYLKKGSFIENAFRIRKKIKQIDKIKPIDIIESNESGLFYLPSKTSYKKVIRLHGGHCFFAESENRPINKWKNIQEKISFKKADIFAAPSKYVVNHTSKYLSTGTKKVEIINFPLNSDIFRQADFSKIIPHKLVFAGTVCEKKGIRQLIEALSILLNKYPDTTLDVYGRDWYFPDKSSYIQYLKNQFSKELLSHITFHGAIKLSDIPTKYEEAELCVFPSHMETLGLVAPEAMMMGKPVLFSNTGPGPETVSHKETGLLCDPHNPDNIAENISFAFENRTIMKEIALNGQKYAIEKFNKENNYLHNFEFYSSIINN
ncbi:MAG: glycosyltransferase family 4 protein [Marinilabiliaceae bacterium]|nr:glycosyltransferase family 4 protein [Marinilabiliaceae bacterium]